MSDERTEAEVEAEYAAVLNRLGAMNMSLGIRPWQTSIHWPDWRNPHPPGSPEFGKLQQIRAAALELERRRAELRAELEAFMNAGIERNIAAAKRRASK